MRHKLFRNAGIYLTSNVIGSLLTLLLLPILTRVLTPTDYGIAAMFVIFLGFIAPFTSLCTTSAISVRYFQLSEKRMSGYIGSLLGIIVFFTALVVFVIALFGSYFESITQIPLNWLVAAVFVSAFQHIIEIRLSLWQVQHKAVNYGVVRVSQNIVNAIISLFLIIMLKMAWEGRVIGHTASVLMFALPILFLLFKDRKITVSTQVKTDVKDALKYGIPLIPHILGGFLISAIDRVMITNMLDIAQAGIYAVVIQFGAILGLLTASFNNAYAPWLIESLSKKDCARDKLIVQGTYAYFVLAIVLAIIIGILAPWLLLLVGEQYRSAEPAIIYIALGQAFGGMYLMVTNYVFFAGKTHYLAWVTFASGLFNIAAIYLLITINQLEGVAQAFMLSMLFKFLGTWYLAHKSRPMPWKQALS